jgi:hypothetical protein
LVEENFDEVKAEAPSKRRTTTEGRYSLTTTLWRRLLQEKNSGRDEVGIRRKNNRRRV